MTETNPKKGLIEKKTHHMVVEFVSFTLFTSYKCTLENTNLLVIYLNNNFFRTNKFELIVLDE